MEKDEDFNLVLKNDQELDGLWAAKRKDILFEGAAQNSEVRMNIAYLQVHEKTCIEFITMLEMHDMTV